VRHPARLLSRLALVLFALAGSRPELRAQRPTRLEIRVLDAATNQSTPVRVRLTQNGRAVKTLPTEAVSVMYGLWDHEDGFSFQPDSSFYVAGTFSLNLPPGRYRIDLSKGIEFLYQSHELTVPAGQTLRKTYRLTRWHDAAARGWYSTDGHIHIRRSPRENGPLLTWTRAEDVRVGVFLRMGDFWETYYPQYAYGAAGVFAQHGHLLVPGQEDPRTPELGHALGYGMTNRVRFRDQYYLYDSVFTRIHELGGLTGYAHHAEAFHAYRGLTLDALRGLVDVLEILQYCVSPRPLRTAHYYHLLDLGFPVTATAGSDFPWCGQDHDHGSPEHSARIGNARFYVKTDGPLTYESWKRAFAAGHTFVTSGPMLEFRVNDKLPGDRLDVRRGTRLTISAEAFGHATQVPLDTLEVIGHGRVLARVVRGEAGQSTSRLVLNLILPPLERGLWLAARAVAGSQQAGHTTPVYVTVDGGGFHNPETAQRYLDLSEGYLREIEAELAAGPQDDPERRLWYYRKPLRDRIAQTRQLIAALRERLH
jgi:hypothetical protein